MGAFDHLLTFMEDWTNPLLEAFLPSGMNDTESICADQTYQHQANVVELDGASNSNALAEPRASNRGCLRERIAGKGNFNPLRLDTNNLSKAPEEIQGPYLTIPPGLSPTSLLESPVFLSNPRAFPSPTTGKLPLDPYGNNQDSALLVDGIDKGKENTFQGANASSFAYKHVAESSGRPYFYAVNRVNAPSFAPQSFSINDINIPDNFLLQSMEPSNIYLHNNAGSFHQKTYTSYAENLSPAQLYNLYGVQEHPPLNGQQVDNGQRRSTEDPYVDGGPAEDGYNWRKYGQKPVRGSNYPRSYFKCTHPNCPVKKKVERSLEGYITEIVYKGAHNHSKPSSINRFTLNFPNPLDEPQLEQPKTSADNGDFDWSIMLETFEGNNSSTRGDQSVNLSNDEDYDFVTHGSASLGCDGEEEESESKRRKTEAYGSDMDGNGSSKAREPRVVVQTTSDIDILDDGFRWRKYGQKVVKGNPNPRSYYKCTTPSCNVRKHVERASQDLRSVITTYDGRHNHEAPAARHTNSHICSAASGHFNIHNPSTTMGQFEGNQYGVPHYRQGKARHGSGPPDHVYGMTQGQQVFMASKMETHSDSGMNASDASEVYSQLVNHLPPLGSQMEIL